MVLNTLHPMLSALPGVASGSWIVEPATALRGSHRLWTAMAADRSWRQRKRLLAQGECPVLISRSARYQRDKDAAAASCSWRQPSMSFHAAQAALHPPRWSVHTLGLLPTHQFPPERVLGPQAAARRFRSSLAAPGQPAYPKT